MSEENEGRISVNDSTDKIEKADGEMKGIEISATSPISKKSFVQVDLSKVTPINIHAPDEKRRSRK